MGAELTRLAMVLFFTCGLVPPRQCFSSRGYLTAVSAALETCLNCSRGLTAGSLKENMGVGNYHVFKALLLILTAHFSQGQSALQAHCTSSNTLWSCPHAHSSSLLTASPVNGALCSGPYLFSHIIPLASVLPLLLAFCVGATCVAVWPATSMVCSS